MPADPGESAVTIPAGETEATAGASLDHSISASGTRRPSGSLTIASSVTLAPTASESALGATFTVSTQGVRRPAGSSEQARHANPRRSARQPRPGCEAGAENQATHYGGQFRLIGQAGD